MSRNSRCVGTTVMTMAWTAAAILTACAQAVDQGSAGSSTSSSEALQSVLGCQVTRQVCVAAAKSFSDVNTCDTQLRSCLLATLPQGGLVPPLTPSPIGFDGAAPVPLLPDASFPRPSFPDAGLQLPQPPSFPDAGPQLPGLMLPDAAPAPLPAPAFPDAGFPVPQPPGLGGALPPQAVCQANLQTCLFAQTSPPVCADQARICLTAAVQAQCDAQEKACLAAGIPQPACTAQRQACR